MTVFFRFFIIEFKRLLSKRNLILFLLFLFLSLYFVQEGVNDYKMVIRNKENFSRNHYQLLKDVDLDTFRSLIEQWTLDYAEHWAAADG